MRNAFLLSSLLVLSSLCAFSQPFVLGGTLKFEKYDPHTKVYLLKINHLNQLLSGSALSVVDSSAIRPDGSFRFTNSDVIEDSIFYRLNVVNTAKENPGAIYMVGTNENFAFFLLHKHAQINLQTHAKKVSDQLVLTKADLPNHLICKLTKICRKYNELTDRLVKRRNALNENLPSYADSVKKIRAEMIDGAYTTHHYENIKTFADTVSDPYVALLATQFLPEDVFTAFQAEMSERFQKTIPHSRYAAQYKAMLKNVPLFLEIGSKAPDIALPDDKGKTIHLSDLKGKCVLIDFWASWCAPCRTESRQRIKPLYNKYGDKGFTVLAVSEDIDKTKWLKAIEEDGTGIWYNVSDMRGQASKTITDYMVTGLPYNYVIGPDGTIIARDLRGKELEQFLEKYYASK